MKGSRIAAVGLVVAAVAWIASGHLIPHEHESKAAVRPTQGENEKLFRVATQRTQLISHAQKLTLSGRTEADRRVIATARTSGIITDLKVRRGSYVKEGDIIAVLSDEAREAEVAKAQALVAQRRTELEARARLVAQGTMPRLELANLEALAKAAEAQLAMAEAERARSLVKAPWSGIVSDTPAEIGQAASPGKEIAQIVALNPMLAVAEVAERRLAGIAVGGDATIRLVTGETAKGRIRYVSKTASPTTRTYRVDVEVENADGSIPDGITAEVIIPLPAVPATKVPRSALTFSSGGDLGVRVVDASGKVAFVPVSVLEDEQQFMRVTGLQDGMQLIVQGQDFVRENQAVEAVDIATIKSAER
jgi:multidrug efflux system membrane fusion protein